MASPLSSNNHQYFTWNYIFISHILRVLLGAFVGFRVPANPLRFEHWGAREDLPLIDHALTRFTISRLSTTNSQHTRHKIYTGSGHHCGVIPYSSVVVVDCLLG